MNIILYTLLIQFFIYLPTNGQQNPIICNYGVGKCPGQLLNNFCHLIFDGPPIKVISTDEQGCYMACTQTAECWLAKYKNSQCSLYPKSAKCQLGGPDLVYQWKCCNIPSVCRNQPNRCRGFWLQREMTVFEGSRIIKTMELTNQGEICRKECIQTPICAHVNFIDKTVCQLLMPSTNVTRIFNKTVNSFDWQCCPEPDWPKECRNAPGKCNGYWLADKLEPQPSQRVLSIVLAMSPLDCRKECEENPFCSKAFVNLTNFNCLLMSDASPDINGSQCSSFNNIFDKGFSWHSYSWHCCNPKDNPLSPPDDNPPTNNGQCVCLNSTADKSITVAGDGCSEPLLDSKITFNSELAAFWLKERLQVLVKGQPWTRVYNGEVYIWLNVALEEFQICPTESCLLYSTIVSPSTCPEIVSREDWFAKPPVGKLDRFAATPNVIVILNSVCPVYGCHSALSCKSCSRDLQSSYITKPAGMSDLPYNYMIGEDGRVYEGRGPNFVGAHTLGYNSMSLGIGFFGWFENRTPSIKSLIGARRLLKCLVERGNLSASYEMFGHRDLRDSAAPGYYLYHLLPNWGNYYDEKIPKGLHCEHIRAKQMQRFILIISCASAGGIFLVVLAVMYQRTYRHSPWCPVRRKPSSRHRKINLICSVGSENILTQQNMADWQCKCTIRDAEEFHIQPGSKDLVILVERPSNCQCLRFFQLMWSKCIIEASCHFPSRLLYSSASRCCDRHSFLLWTCESPYLFHIKDISILKSAVNKAIHGNCICTVRRFRNYVAIVPELETFEGFTPDNWLLNVRKLKRLRRRDNVGLDPYCRLPSSAAEDDIDESYADYRLRNDSRETEPVALDISGKMLQDVNQLLM